MSITTCGILFVKDCKILLGKVPGQDHYDIPKGKQEDGESWREAAIRETLEETGIVVDSNNLTALGNLPYRPGKNLSLFIYDLDGPALRTVKRNINVMKANEQRIELDDFIYAEFNELATLVKPRLLRAIGRSLLQRAHNDYQKERL